MTIRPKIPLAVATCRDCGDIRIPVTDITLSILDGTITYPCPECGRMAQRPSPLQAEAALLAQGARLVVQ